MMFDSVVIKLIRKGAGVSPDYSLTITGKGNITYEGKENVEVKGERTERINEKEIIKLLADFKKIDFFSLNDIYPIENSDGRASSIISISITDEKGGMKHKIITHYHGDKNVPRELLNLEDKIDEITESKRWIEKPSKVSSKKPKSSSKKVESIVSKHEKSAIVRKKSLPLTKKIIGVIFVLVILFFILYLIQSGFMNQNSTDDKNNDELLLIAEIQASSYSGVAPLTINFQGVSKNFEEKIESYNWTIGNDATYQGQNITHTFTNKGTYTVSLTITDISDEKAMRDIQITVDPALEIKIEVNKTVGKSPLNISFTSYVNGGTPPYTYTWDFDDGNTSIEQNVNHTFFKEKYYNIRVIATDSLGLTTNDVVNILCRS